MELSLRQKQILQLLSLGKSNKEIAFELNLSEGTVKQHLYTLYKKLGVTSRSKAVLSAAKILSELKEEDLSSQAPAELLEKKLPSAYVWRLISAAAVYPRPKKLNTPGAIADFDLAMKQIHREAKKIADSLDGTLTVVPGVGLVACFGVPKAHLNDSARAMIFANHLFQWVVRHKIIPISMGIATAAEVVADKTNTIYRAESFELAAKYAVAAPAYRILANEISCRLAGPLLKYSSPKHDVSKGSSVREVLLGEPLEFQELAKKTPLPFMAEIIQKNRTMNAQWVNVSGWPPFHAQRLQDTIAIHCKASGIQTYCLRLPSTTNPEKTTQSILDQLFLQLRLSKDSDATQIFSRVSPLTNSKVLTILKTLAMRNPVAMVTYGINTHLELMKILGTKGIDELSKLPIIFINSEVNDEDLSHVRVTLLGNKPGVPGKYKAYQLPLSRPFKTPHDIHSDLATLIDNLSDRAHDVIQLIVTKGAVKAMGINSFLGEVMATGLFSVVDGVIRCRDQATQKALQSMYVTS